MFPEEAECDAPALITAASQRTAFLQMALGKVNFFAQYGAANNQISQLIMIIVIAIVNTGIINIKTIPHNEGKKKSPPLQSV